MPKDQEADQPRIVAGVDTHKDLHFAAIVDGHDRVIASESFASTRQGYKKMLTWMQSHGTIDRVGIECTGTYGAGLLRYLQAAGIRVLEVTAPDKADRRRRAKDDMLDAVNAAHAAYPGVRTVTPKSRDGMIEALRVSQKLQENSGLRPKGRLATDPEQHRQRPGSFARTAPCDDPHAADPHSGSLAPGPDRLP
jgi:transposase